MNGCCRRRPLRTAIPPIAKWRQAILAAFTAKQGIFLIVLFFALAFIGCTQVPKAVDSASPIQMRSIQTRAFDTDKKRFVVRGVIATLQDFGFIVDRANMDLGTISATKLHEVNHTGTYLNSTPGKSRYSSHAQALRVTITVRPKSGGKMKVRANLRDDLTVVDDPENVSAIFCSLSEVAISFSPA